MSTPFCEEDRPLKSLLWQNRVEGLFTMLPPEGFPVCHFPRALALSASSPRFFADHLSHSDEPRVEERTNGSDSGPEKSGEYFSLFALDRNALAEQSLKYAKSNYCAKHPNVSRTKNPARSARDEDNSKQPSGQRGNITLAPKKLLCSSTQFCSFHSRTEVFLTNS